MTPRLTGFGHSAPGKIRKNDDPIFDWLKKNNPAGMALFKGYEERRVLCDGESIVYIMKPAAEMALAAADVSPADVDLLIGDGSIGAYTTPNAISDLHRELGLGGSVWPIAVANEFSQFNAAIMIADALIRAGRAKNILIALGDDWTRFVSYQTAQSVSAADGAAAAVMSARQDMGGWAFVDQITVVDTSYFGSMKMQADVIDQSGGDGGDPGVLTRRFFQINEKGLEGFKKFGIETSPKAVLDLLAKNGVDAKDVCLLTHQASATLMDAWAADIKPGAYVNTISEFANMVLASVPFNFSYGIAQPRGIEQDFVVTLCLGPNMHANATLLKRV